jgi:hypothetical protein
MSNLARSDLLPTRRSGSPRSARWPDRFTTPRGRPAGEAGRTTAPRSRLRSRPASSPAPNRPEQGARAKQSHNDARDVETRHGRDAELQDVPRDAHLRDAARREPERQRERGRRMIAISTLATKTATNRVASCRNDGPKRAPSAHPSNRCPALDPGIRNAKRSISPAVRGTANACKPSTNAFGTPASSATPARQTLAPSGARTPVPRMSTLPARRGRAHGCRAPRTPRERARSRRARATYASRRRRPPA